MSEQKNPITIEEQIKAALTGDTLTNALSFAAFLQSNNIPADAHDLFYLHIDGSDEVPGPWTIWLMSTDTKSPACDDVKETAWAHANVCGHFSTGGEACGCGSQPGKCVNIFGKEFDNICNSPLMFTNPDAKTLEAVKKLILLLK